MDRTQPLPDYVGIPVLALYSERDGITPWALHGAQVVSQIAHAESRLVAGGGHWLQFEAPEACARHTIEFFSRS